MKITISRPFLVALSLLFFACEAKSQNIEPKYGEYEVGFRVIRTTDNSRVYKKIGDKEYGPRPMQIYVWYPAKKSNNEVIKLEDYMVLGITEETLAKPTDGHYTAALNLYSSITGDAEKTKTLFKHKYKSKDQPSAIDQKFPLILYGAAQSSSGFGNIRLCEQLASYGYVVVSVASKNYFNRDMPLNIEGAQAHTRDLEFAYGVMHDFPFVDTKQVGAFGFSFGGLNIINFALLNPNVKAVVSLDGSIPLGYGLGIYDSFELTDTKNLRADFLAFNGHKFGKERNADGNLKYRMYDEMTFANGYVYWLKDMLHTSFSSNNLLFFPKDERVQRAYTDIANRTVDFMNMKFKGSKDFEANFKNTSKDLYDEFQWKAAASGPLVAKKDFIDYVKENGIDKAKKVYEETKADFPDYVLFDYDPFRDVGFLFMMKKDFKNALKAYKILVDAYPTESDSYRRIGEAYMENEMYDEAKKAFLKGKKLAPDNSAFPNLLKQLEDKRKN